MKIHGIVCVKDEASRYLDSCLSWMSHIVDDIFVYDDRSTDDSVAISIANGCEVSIRPTSIPSFIEHEGKFRSAAWSSFEEIVSPSLGDWILAFDSDEFLVSGTDVRSSLGRSIEYAENHGNIGVMLHFPEVFKFSDNRAYIRTDGFWNSIYGPRLFAYKPNAVWNDKPMGCGSQPEYVARGNLSRETYGLKMLHFGYASDEDKYLKYKRYSSLYNHGHSSKHIESILSSSVLVEWDGITPKLN